MIFVTVGTQLGFPRLIDAMNAFAADSGEEVIAQVGKSSGDWPHLDCRAGLAPAEFAETFARARVIVAHAGIGTILSAKRYQRPLIIVPRRHDLGEHRNDHQMATAQALEETSGVHVAWQVDDLPALLGNEALEAAGQGTGPRHGSLIEGLADFIAAPRRRGAKVSARKTSG